MKRCLAMIVVLVLATVFVSTLITAALNFSQKALKSVSDCAPAEATTVPTRIKHPSVRLSVIII